LTRIAGRLEFTVAVDEAQRPLGTVDLIWPDKAYALRLTQYRLHQPVFRTRVLRAYDDTCAMCRLRHAELGTTSRYRFGPRSSGWIDRCQRQRPSI